MYITVRVDGRLETTDDEHAYIPDDVGKEGSCS